MTALVWDQVGTRKYQTGVDRGVLYLPDYAVPWNGLISIEEDLVREVKSYYLDGIKYLDHFVPGSYSAKLQAFTYPDEFEEIQGNGRFVGGVYVHDQRTRLFNMSYRTREGNDLEGIDYAYRLHILYNLQVVPANAALASIGETVVASAFSWTLLGTPPLMTGIRPTCHVSIHSRDVNESLLEHIERLLYGTEDEDPTLPTMIELLSIAEQEGGGVIAT
jgi:hypothetical protein